jgi:NitT/TauT family transport system substrate-binding protein
MCTGTRVRARALVGLAAAVVLAASGSLTSATAANPAGAQPLHKVTLRLPWLAGAYAAPFLLANARGYYKQAGFDVSIGEGKGSSITAQTVASGSDTFGIADVSAIALVISKGGPVKVVFCFTQSTPMGFIHDPDVVIKTPRDIIGHPIITSPGDITRQILKAVLAKGGVPEQRITYRMIDPSAYFSTFKNTPGAIMLGFSTVDLQNAQKVDPKAVFTPFTDFGINTLSYSLFTGTRMIQQHPDEVRAFVAASVKGWRATQADPAAAVEATVAAFPQADKTVVANGMPWVLKLTHTPASKGKPLGWMAASDWTQTLDILHTYVGMDTVKPLADYYTNEFVPGR